MKKMYLFALLALSVMSYGQNLISNGTFDTNTTGWTFPNGGVSRTTVTAQNRNASAGALTFATTFRSAYTPFTATVGTAYTATVYVRHELATTTGDNNLYMSIAGPSGVALSQPIVGFTAPHPVTTPSYIIYRLTFVAPQTSLTLSMFRQGNAAASGGNTINIDDVSVEEGAITSITSPGPYSFTGDATPKTPTFSVTPTFAASYRGSIYATSATAPSASGNYNVIAGVANGTGRDYLNVAFLITGVSTVGTVPASFVNNGQALSTATFSGGVTNVPGTFTFTTPSTVPSMGSSSQNYTFTPTDTANFTTVTGNLTVITGQVFGWNTSTLSGGTNNFGANNFNSTTRDSNLTTTGFSRGSGFGTTGSGVARGWGGTTIASIATAAAAITANHFFTFTVRPTTAGTTMSLHSIDPFSYRRTVAGASAGTLQYSIDGTNFTDIGSPISFSSTAAGGATLASPISLSGITALQNVPSTTTVTFRLLLHGTNATGGGVFYIFDVANTTQSDLSFQGTVTTTSTYTTSWDNGTPTASVNAIIAGDYTGGSFTCNNLTVNATKTLTVATGTSVTVGDALVNNGIIIVENNANLIQTALSNTNSGSGTTTVNRNGSTLKRLDYTLWSSPVAAQNLKGFSSLTVDPRFYTYNEGIDKFSVVSNPSGTTFTPGRSFFIRMPDEYPQGSGNATPYYLGNTTLAYPGVFTGTLNNGNVPVTLTKGLNGYQAVGNPYPSVIDAQTFVTANTANIENTLYFWRKTNAASGSSYATWTSGGSTSVTPTSGTPNAKIQVGQGFIVQAKNAGTVANFFTNAMRETAPTSTQFFKVKQTAQKDRVWLNLTGANDIFGQALVAYITDATVGLDQYDGKYINDSDIALTSSIAGDEYTIQGRPAFDATDVVALNFKTSVAGTYTIAIDHVDGLFSNGQAIYLVDKKLGVTTNLNEGAYGFTAEAGVDNTRFELTYQKTLKVDAPLFNENSVFVSRTNGTLNVKSSAVAINNVKVFDVQGRLVAERKNVKSNSASFSNLKANQVLIVKVTSENNAVVTKKVLN